MRVRERVRMKSDRWNEGPEGRVIAVGGKRNPGRVTVHWDGGKIVELASEELRLIWSPYVRVAQPVVGE